MAIRDRRKLRVEERDVVLHIQVAGMVGAMTEHQLTGLRDGSWAPWKLMAQAELDRRARLEA